MPEVDVLMQRVAARLTRVAIRIALAEKAQASAYAGRGVPSPVSETEVIDG